MALSAFEAKAGPPTDSDLRATLGAADAAWTRLPASISDRVGPVTDV